MIRWNMTLERELVEQRTLVKLSLPHHRLHSSSDAGSESMSRLRRNYRVFQRNRCATGHRVRCDLTYATRVKGACVADFEDDSFSTYCLGPGAWDGLNVSVERVIVAQP